MNEQSYIVGTLALWAGDYTRAQEMFSRESNQPGAKFDLNEPNSVGAYITRVSENRYSQLLKQRREFEKSRMALDPEFRNIEAGGYVLRSTIHLAGVLARKDSRSFEMRAFLTDLSWSKQLLENAKHLSLRASDPRWLQSSEQKFEKKSTARKVERLEPKPTGFNWERPGKFFVRVHVNCLGMILAQGFWGDPEFPKFYEIEKHFWGVLRELDPDEDKRPAAEAQNSKR